MITYNTQVMKIMLDEGANRVSGEKLKFIKKRGAAGFSTKECVLEKGDDCANS